MVKVTDLTDALNDSLEMLFRGESLDECLKRYPEHKKELKPLLEEAMIIRKTTRIKARQKFKDELKQKLQKP